VVALAEPAAALEAMVVVVPQQAALVVMHQAAVIAELVEDFKII